jgi:hypothetical protein
MRRLPCSLIILAVCCTQSGCAFNNASHPATPIPADWVETQLFFGLTEHGERIPDAAWHDFVDHSITPRFPDGFTIEYGDGQYRAADGQIHKEPTAILIVLHPRNESQTDDPALDAIAREYVLRFHQESVLRSDSAATARFVSAVATPATR